MGENFLDRENICIYLDRLKPKAPNVLGKPQKKSFFCGFQYLLNENCQNLTKLV